MSDTRIQRRNPQVQFYRSIIKQNYNKIKIFKKELEEVNKYLKDPTNQVMLKKPLYYKNLKNYLKDHIKNSREMVKICSTKITKYTC